MANSSSNWGTPNNSFGGAPLFTTGASFGSNSSSNLSSLGSTTTTPRGTGDSVKGHHMKKDSQGSNRSSASKSKSKESHLSQRKPFVPLSPPVDESGQIGRAVQQECRDRSRMPSSA
eukprot:TRINITY_DN8273_c0_g1_i4.p1 TRINITY_DN8273_c0_g1~~TRINITY_DN8273_c0_g1_i4.p1  ORF type:complete len:133 (-),score=3.29 TRINITY_DN8273_c0_g1_i4:18-368(-)